VNITAGKKSSQLIDDDVRAKTVAVPSSHVVLWLGKDYQAQKCATQNIQENCLTTYATSLIFLVSSEACLT
jgi:hypothetical protein